VIDVVGPGAIGGTIGAFLARAGVRVRLIHRNPAQTAAIRSSGLHITGLEDFTVKVPAYLASEIVGPLQTVLLTVGAAQLPDAMRFIAPRLATDGVVISLLNGIAAHDVALAVGPARTIAGAVSFAGSRKGPNELSYGARGSIAIGEYAGGVTARLREMAKLLRIFGTVEEHENVWGWIWTKVALTSVYTASGVHDWTMLQMFEDAKARTALARLITDVVETAFAEGVELEMVDGLDLSGFRYGRKRDPIAISRVFDELTHMARAVERLRPRNSINRKLRDHQPTEVVPLFEPVIARAAAHGLDVPALKGLVRVFRRLETDPSDLGKDRLQEIAGDALAS
jgi:2-dehydropantoate 2-reductase